MTIEYPKRALKKQTNRVRLLKAAIHLFSVHGFQDTKLVDIASQSGVHVQTLYSHFKSKDDLAIAAAKGVTDGCRKFFETYPTGHSTFQIWRAFIRHTVVGLAPSGWQHKRRQLRAASSLMNDNFLLIVYSGYEDLLTEYLARDLQVDKKYDRLPRQIAAFLCSNNEAAMKRCAGLDTGEDVLDDLEAVLEASVGVIDDAEKIFSHLIKAPRTLQDGSGSVGA